MKKIIICLVSLMLVVCGLAAPVSAAVIDNGSTIQPLWDNTDSIDVTLDFRNNIGKAYSSVIAEFDATSIKTDIYVYRVSGTSLIYVAENHETVMDFISGTTCEFPAIRNATYRIDYTFTVRMNGVDEVINRTIYGTYSSQFN